MTLFDLLEVCDPNINIVLVVKIYGVDTPPIKELEKFIAKNGKKLISNDLLLMEIIQITAPDKNTLKVII